MYAKSLSSMKSCLALQMMRLALLLVLVCLARSFARENIGAPGLSGLQ